MNWQKVSVLRVLLGVGGLLILAGGSTSAPAAPVDLSTTGVVGVVMDAGTEAPIAGAVVAIAGLATPVTSGPDGQFAIENVNWTAVPKEEVGPAAAAISVGRVTVAVTASGYGIWTAKNLDVYSGSTVHLEVRLTLEPAMLDWTCLPRAIAVGKPECQQQPSGPNAATLGGNRMKVRSGKLAAPLLSCSGYYSDVLPPSTIRILHNGTIWVRDFKTYVKEVLPREWSAGWTTESLRAGAMAVRNFAWYWVNNGPGGWYNGQCYDVDSTTNFQVWAPGGTRPETDEAVDSIWAAARMTRGSAIFQSFYKSGYSTDACGQWYGGPAPGHDMSQWGTQACGLQGYGWYAIIRKYYFYSSQAPSHVVVLDDSPAATDYNQPGDTWHLNVYALNRAGNLLENFYNRGTGVWSGWHLNLGGLCTSAPAALAHSTNHLWAFCRGTDGRIYGWRWDGGRWFSGVVLENGWSQSGPAATEYYQPSDTYHLKVFVLGLDGNIYQNLYHTGTNRWSGWIYSLGRPPVECTSAPAADWRTSTDLYVFCRGSDGAVWYTKWNGANWEAWTSLGGWLASGPSATDLYFGGWRIYVHSNNQTGNVFENNRGTGAWSGWYVPFSGGYCASPPGSSDLPKSPSPYYMFVSCRGGNSSIFSRRWNGTTWENWVDLGRPP